MFLNFKIIIKFYINKINKLMFVIINYSLYLILFSKKAFFFIIVIIILKVVKIL